MKLKKSKNYFILTVDRSAVYVILALLIGHYCTPALILAKKIKLPARQAAPSVILSPLPTLTATPAPSPSPQARSWTGEASWYSFAECLGCNDNRIMANGEVLDDTRRTVAFNRAPLGSKVKILNLKNNMITTAIVTDTGGFEKYNRIIDVNWAVKQALNMTGNTQVKITIIN